MAMWNKTHMDTFSCFATLESNVWQGETVKEGIEDFVHGMKTILSSKFLDDLSRCCSWVCLKSCFDEKISTVLAQYLDDAPLDFGLEIAFSLNTLNACQKGKERESERERERRLVRP